MILSNDGLNGVRNQVRESALSSFEFFSNTVLGCSLSEDLCKEVQDVIEDQEDYFVTTKSPRAVAVAIKGWLESKGIPVLTTVALPQHEILHWLEFDRQPEQLETAVTLDVQATGVELKWL